MDEDDLDLIDDIEMWNDYWKSINNERNKKKQMENDLVQKEGEVLDKLLEISKKEREVLDKLLEILKKRSNHKRHR